MSATSENSSTHHLLQAQAQCWNHIFNFISSFAVRYAVQLDIPDVLYKHDKAMSLSDLSAQLPNIDPSKVSSLSILMRFLVHSGFLNQHHDDENQIYYYSLTPASRLLVKNEPLNIRSFLFLNQDPLNIKAWFELSNWFQNDSSSPTAFHTAHGKSFWDFINNEKPIQMGNNFNDAMTSDSRLITNVLISECNKHVFEGLTSLVDVGGNKGTVATAIVKAFPTIKCMVFDLPHVIGDLKGKSSHENLEFVGGSMFDEIPRANAILLKCVLHNWSDEDCVKILKKCKESIPSKDKGGKVIIIDIVMMDDDNPETSHGTVQAQHFMDLLMMVYYAAKDRTKKDWERLFTQAGFSEYKISHTLGSRSLIEIYP